MEFLSWYQGSVIGEAVRTSTWVYPWVNAFHSVGMGFLVGTLLMLSLRVLGFGSFPLAPLRKFVLVAQLAFVVNLITGLMLFAGDAERFFFSPTFRVKAALLVFGGIVAWMLVRRVFGGEAGRAENGKSAQALKVIAAASLVLWIGAIFAGRMTAYLP